MAGAKPTATAPNGGDLITGASRTRKAMKPPYLHPARRCSAACLPRFISCPRPAKWRSPPWKWIFRRKRDTGRCARSLSPPWNRRFSRADTRFAKAICLSPREGEIDLATGAAIPDRVDLSIVLSGHDLNNSIHRPERCMPAQGHDIGSASNVSIGLPNGRKITADACFRCSRYPPMRSARNTSVSTA